MIRQPRTAIYLVAALVLSIPTLARAQEGAPADPAAQTCVPECRSGFMCHEGQCISACNPACGEGERCTDTGECVSACEPACAANEVCTGQGACVSRCAPACAEGQRCTAAGECTGPVAGVSAPGSGGTPDPGWARKAFILSIVTAIVVGGLTAAIVISDDEGVGLPLGIAATVIGGVAIPIVASGGRSARRSGDVQGNPGLRLAGWIIYGLALADAVTLIGLGFGDVDVPASLAGSVGLLGVASAIALGAEARNSAIEAELEAGMIQPGVGAARDASGGLIPTVGVQVSW